jgi:hypothetical protein
MSAQANKKHEDVLGGRSFGRHPTNPRREVENGVRKAVHTAVDGLTVERRDLMLARWEISEELDDRVPALCARRVDMSRSEKRNKQRKRERMNE